MSNDPSIGIVETISFLDSQENDASSNNNDTDMLNEPLLNTTTTTSTTANNYHHLHHKFKTTITSCIQSILQIYSDQSVSSCLTLTKGLSIPFSIGIFLGLIIPKNPNLPSPFYQYISSILGYTYFVSWSVSFYPQIITNYKRKKIDGLSVDASILAVLNYICYTIYTSFFFWDGTIRQEYKDRNGENSEVTVMSNDVAFAMHSLILTSITLCQVVYYKGFVEQPMSWVCGAIVMGTLGISLVYVICIGVKVPGFLWIDFLYMMGTIKLVLTIMTYVPQIVLNFQRRSTAGWCCRDGESFLLLFVCFLFRCTYSSYVNFAFILVLN